MLYTAAKLKNFAKNYKYSVPLAAGLLLVGYFALAGGGEEPRQDFVTVARTAVAQEVSVTGRVEPAAEVDLAVEAGGKVSSIPVAVGTRVRAGQTLLTVASADLTVRLAKQRAALEQARLVLAKQEPKTTSSDDLDKALEDGYNAVADAFLDMPPVITGLDEMLGRDYLSGNMVRAQYGERARDMRDLAETGYYDAKDAYDGVLARYKTLTRGSSEAAIESLIVETHEAARSLSDAVKSMNNFLDYVENRMSDATRAAHPELAEDQSSLDNYTGRINGHLTALLDARDAIKDSKIGITDENYDLSSTRLDIRQAELDVQDTLVQIGERTIVSPIDGTVTAVDARVGEAISAGSPAISVISSSRYQIEVQLPEADVAKVSVGARATVVLDAYQDALFEARVSSIDPAETLLDGVATYRAVLMFDTADERIKSGMTADTVIYGPRKENVLAVPQRAVISADGRKYVRVMEGEAVVEKDVETGLRGSDGNIEIISGLAEGDRVIVFTQPH